MLTAHFLGLALFCLSFLALGCFSMSRYAPNSPQLVAGSAELANTFSIARGRWRMQIALTIVLGGAAVWIIVAARHGPDDKSWAYGSLATLLGYWLKG